MPNETEIAQQEQGAAPESIADITNEIRGYFDLLKRGLIPDNVARMTTRQRHQFWADRIEAAAKRERTDLADAHDSIVRLESEIAEVKRERDSLAAENALSARPQPGNSAAMRKLLESIIREAGNCYKFVKEKQHGGPVSGGTWGAIAATFSEIAEWARNALVEPARNCDIYPANEWKKRFEKFCDAYPVGSCHECPFYAKWDFSDRKKPSCLALWAVAPAEREGAADA